MKRPTPYLVAVAMLLLPAAPTSGQDGRALFDQHCAACHTIGGGANGAPDLKGVTAQRDREWLLKFILNPEAVTRSGDPRAAELLRMYDGALMPAPEGLDRASILAILDYIASRSGADAAPAAAGPPPTFTPEDIARGRALYRGDLRLAGHGPSCLSCHAAGAADLLGAGSFGPALAGVTTRLNGANGLSAWLASPPTPVMRSVYRRAPLAADEVRALAAFLDAEATAAPQSGLPRAAAFAGLALAATVAGFLAIGLIWRDRFRAVRRPLVSMSGGSR